MRILVTGPSGMLGSAILKNRNRNYQLVPVSRSSLDITRIDQVKSFMHEV